MTNDLDPFTARRYLAYLLRKPYGPRVLWRIGLDDAEQWVWLAWCECGRPESRSRQVLRVAWAYICRDAYRTSRPGHNVDPAYVAEEAPPERQWLQLVLDYYEDHTAAETIARWGLPDTARVRHWLGRCLPKPGRASGKKYGERRIRMATCQSYAELVASGLSKATAWRASKRGWYWRRADAGAPPPPRNDMFRPPSTARRQRVHTSLGHRELMAQGVPESTARDAAKRGWYMQWT